jgi:hypothetical protein
MADTPERRKDYALRRRIDVLLDRVRRSREEIVERGLDAVHKPDRDDADSHPGVDDDTRSAPS